MKGVLAGVIRLSIGSAYIFGATPVFASRWVDVGKDSLGSDIQIDEESLIADEQTRTVWVKTTLSRPRADGATSDVNQVQIDCVGRRIRVIEISTYQADGTVMFSGPGTGRFSPMRPDSVGDILRTAVCPK